MNIKYAELWRFLSPRVLLLGLSILYSSSSYAQEDSPNIVKLNLVSASLGQFSGEYERILTTKFSLNGSVSFMPIRSLPFKSAISKSLGSSSVVNSMRLGIFAAAVEGRYYWTKNNKPAEGFYLAPFVKYAKYDINSKVEYSLGSLARASIPISGDFSTFTGGVAVGAQWKLKERLLLDWRIIGLSYGVSNGSVVGRKELTSEDQRQILEKLNDLSDRLPILDLVTRVTENGVRSTIDGSWLGVRMGLSIGYRF